MTAAGQWSEVEIAGKSADIYQPGNTIGEPRAIVFLHGHGRERLRDNETFTREFERHGLIAVCPEGGRSWWLDVVCRDFDHQVTPLAYLRDQVVPFINSKWNISPPAIGLLGVSMGGQGALQLAYLKARRFPIVAAISPALDFYRVWGQGLPIDEMFASPEDARQETAILKIHPLNWPKHQLLVCDPADEYWFEGVERLTLKLYSSGIPFESDFTTSAGGHTWRYFNTMAEPVIEFLAERLEQESRRI